MIQSKFYSSKMVLKTLIIDDEPLARQRLVNLIEDVDDIEIIGECKTGKETIEKIDKLEPDLIFLDIQLKDMTGFDVLEAITVKKFPKVIFVTAFDEYALKAFDYFAFDYLLKPFKDERFFKSVYKVIEESKNEDLHGFDEKLNDLMNFIQKPVIGSPNNKLPVRLGNKIHFIDTKDIKYITASGYYAEIHTDDKTHLLRESLSRLIEELDSNDFFRIHRSTIINLNYISELVSSSYGEIDVKMKDNKLFRISKSYKKVFIDKMGL